MKNKAIFPIINLIFCLILFSLCGCSEKDTPSDVSKSLEETEKILKKAGALEKTELKGIPFDKFWKAVKEEGKKWAGKDFYVVKIESFRINGFAAHDGFAAVWRAKILKAGEKKTKYVSFSEIKHIKAPKGLFIGSEDKFSYYGSAIEPSKIKLTANDADKKAKAYKKFKATGYDQFIYVLKADGDKKDTPVWFVTKECTAKGIIKKKCSSKNSWRIKINAQNGEMIQ